MRENPEKMAVDKFDRNHIFFSNSKRFEPVFSRATWLPRDWS